MFIERTKMLLGQKKISKNKMMTDLGLGSGTFATWEKRGTIPNGEILSKIADYLNVTVDYLLGKEKAPAASKSSKGVLIPVLGRVAAGIPLEAVEDIIDYEEIPERWAASGEYFALEIHGQSMEPKFSEGDVVIVKKQDYADTGDTVIVLVNGSDATCKKIKFTDSGIMLIPTNPLYEPMFYSDMDIETLPVQILGKVVELRAKF